jgi:hypothetical protein
MKFQEFAPTWYEAIQILKKSGWTNWNEYFKFCDKQNINLGYNNKCIVGEAWGFSDKYMDGGCSECQRSAIGFNLAMKSLSFFNQSMKLFEDHFCEKHLEKKK